MTDDWLKNINNGLITGLIYVYLIKAFGTINHEITLETLAAYIWYLLVNTSDDPHFILQY